ncbi:HIT-like domain-containing protein [Corynascus novoguineensis]|uniref:Aprataxin-like protein n=1 Tax=Corynascus novoguineensis TaxID=1126955 RepID=A0AAN7CUV2_9PEZI|nr:HIT-like domain-containing protein [Corynascus novoguineensis]
MVDLAEDADDVPQPESAPLTTDQQQQDSPSATRATPSSPEPLAKRNAFTELMAPKPKAPISQAPQSLAHKASQVIRGVWRGALIEYIEHPERFPDQVLRVTDKTVLIKDAFPKATIHLLLLPRSPAHYLLHPHTAFDDSAFLAMMREEAAVATRLATAELARRLGPFSATNRARDEAMSRLCQEGDCDQQQHQLPPGRDYSRDIRVGTHAHPSMAHLHVHIISRDMHSERMRHRKHYNSFNTPFFVPLADYPLAADDVRRETGFQNGNLAKELVCWRCGKGFGNRFAELKRHLEDEFEKWRAE